MILLTGRSFKELILHCNHGIVYDQSLCIFGRYAKTCHWLDIRHFSLQMSHYTIIVSCRLGKARNGHYAVVLMRCFDFLLT